MSEDSKTEIKSWNEQLANWKKKIGKSIYRLGQETGIPRATLQRYINGKVTNLDKIKTENLQALYKATGLECFKYETPKIEMPVAQTYPQKSKYMQAKTAEELKNILQKDLETGMQETEVLLGKTTSLMMSEGKKGLDRLLESLTSDLNLTGMGKLKAGLLKAQRYRPSTEERADAILELLDILSEEVDYFRTAPEEEKMILVRSLQNEPDSFSYVNQMLNIIYQGKKLDSWMLMAQPPSKIKKIMKKQ